MATPILPPAQGTISDYYESYRQHIMENDMFKGLVAQGELTHQFIKSLPEKQGDNRYQEGKWSVKEVLGHILDTERILTYRILCFMRGERQALPGFEENDYVRNSNYSTRTLKDIGEELYAVRQSTVHMIMNMDQNSLDDVGIANGAEVSIRALIYMVLVHERHHVKFIKKTYLNQ
ncbi:MAG: DinB family protein [Bacteroidetes bacterium]|nr:DinB family protein [Bacteroidota bacterium]MBK8362486.1 DinB family protein [Bacteroidota bacterium]MBL0032456.1 DinB family protein [Bacteroidota bacterium]